MRLKPAALLRMALRSGVGFPSTWRATGVLHHLDKYPLAERYKAWVAELGEMPRNANAAFLDWVRKFGKGTRS